MTELSRDQLVADLAQDVVAELAPKELPMFRARSNAYFKNPERIFESKPAKDEMLGFGVEAALPILTPAVLAMATTVVDFIVAAIKEPLKDGIKGILGDGVINLFGKLKTLQKEGESKKDENRVSQGEADPLTPEQLKQVRKLAIQQGLKMGLSEETAEILADSLLGRLALSAPRFNR